MVMGVWSCWCLMVKVQHSHSLSTKSTWWVFGRCFKSLKISLTLRRYCSVILTQTLPFLILPVSQGTTNSWLRVIPRTKFGAFARGAKVVVYTKKSGPHTRIIDGGSGYLCEMEPVAHFGLGKFFSSTQSCRRDWTCNLWLEMFSARAATNDYIIRNYFSDELVNCFSYGKCPSTFLGAQNDVFRLHVLFNLQPKTQWYLLYNVIQLGKAANSQISVV